jgi:hypothetical protein
MANTADNLHEHGEFWRPPLENRAETLPAVTSESCTRCGSEFVTGSRFCHVCGAVREGQVGSRRFQWLRFLDIHRMQERLGLSLASVVALIVGVICTLAAVGTGLIFTATTVLDWQAVQIWRIEWLLAAVVAFLAGILLRSAGGPKREQ